MAEAEREAIARQLRSPRAAATAGILFSVMHIAGMIALSGTDDPAAIDRDWLQAFSRATSLVLTLVPFSGIALLWFTGVIRDWLGDREDRFFSTIFFGSGVLYVAMTFVWAAAFGAVVRSYTLAAELLADDDVLIFGVAMMNEILGTFALRMAGVYMLSIGSLWTRARAVPRWLIVVTTVVALGFIFLAGSIREARYIFPAWVLLVSAFILVQNYRGTHPDDGGDAPTPATEAQTAD